MIHRRTDAALKLGVLGGGLSTAATAVLMDGAGQWATLVVLFVALTLVYVAALWYAPDAETVADDWSDRHDDGADAGGSA